MNKNYTSIGIAARIWFLTAIIFSISPIFYLLVNESFNFSLTLLVAVAALCGSIPAAIGMSIGASLINDSDADWRIKCCRFLIVLGVLVLPYGFLGASLDVLGSSHLFEERPQFAASAFIISAILFLCALVACLVVLRPIYYYFNNNPADTKSYTVILQHLFSFTIKSQYTMDTENYLPDALPATKQTNKILIKGLITGVLILLMLIPTIFINNLINEREARQKEVVKEVSSKWASAQTLAGPFLVVPYTDTFVNSEGKSVSTKTKLLLLANDLNVLGKIIPEERPRSIYKVLLYKADVSMAGKFKIKWPVDINPASIDFTGAKLCFSLTDFKGIEEEIYVTFNGEKLLLTPGLPVADMGNVGLSVPVNITAETITNELPFSLQVKLKGSEQLHFMPVSASSKFQLSSVWPSPSFDGDMLPGDRQVSDSGFTAKWNFNQANLPFGTVVKQNTLQDKAMAFGVSFVQPSDQYNKTMRSVKYAILFIGLTFAFFFIIELMQQKPFHPVQYVLVGLALVIFYTLLLSISEYILFDHAYLIAAGATITLISVYAKEHFKSWKTAAIFFALLSCLYGFIFILIRLEDTALLVGSIGLFVVLALVMFVSRKINWYGDTAITVKNI